MLVSDEAPEATCLSILCGSFRRLVRRLFPLHASLWQGGDGRRDDPSIRPTFDRARGSGCGSHPLAECLPEPGRWPGRFPPDGAPFRPGPSPGGCDPGHSRPRSSSPPFVSPRRLGSSRRHGRLVCVPLRHVLPIGVSGEEASDLVTFVSSPTSGGRPLQRAGNSGLRQPSLPAPAPPRLTSHRQVYPRAGRG